LAIAQQLKTTKLEKFLYNFLPSCILLIIARDDVLRFFAIVLNFLNLIINLRQTGLVEENDRD